MQVRRTYWKRCFPNHFSASIGVEEAQFYGAYNLASPDDPLGPLGTKASQCFVTIERVGLKLTPRRDIQFQLEHIVKSDGESWKLTDFNFVALIWEGLTPKGIPVGFKAFNITPHMNTRGEISEVTFDGRLLYIRRKHRNRGLGQFLSAAVGMWLNECRVFHPYASKRGIGVSYVSEYHSNGGEKCGDIIREHFMCMKDMCADAATERIGWHVAEFVDDSSV